MNKIRNELVATVYNRALALTDYNIQNTLDKRFEFRKKIIRADKSLTENEKSYAMEELNKDFDYHKVLFNEGTKRICENCHDECLATLFCEHCVRNYLKENFSNWTSGNNDIDDLIQQCQSEILSPDKIVEWIPYNKFENINFLTKGGCSEIYTADWINGSYDEWDSKEKQLKRFGDQVVYWHSYVGNFIWSITFINFENDYYLAMNIINGMRPKIVPGTLLEYKELMEQCWDADPEKRPNIDTFSNKIQEMNRLNYQNESNKNKSNKNIIKKLTEKIRLTKPKSNTISKINEINNFEISSNTSSRLFTSKVYQFKNLPEPKNATEEEQEAFYSKPYSYNIPDNIDDIVNKNDDNTSKSSDDKKLSEALGNMQINSNNNIQNDYIKEFILAEKHNNDDIDDENGIYNNPNLYPEEQDEFEIPDDGF
ncbi:hypothetical protein RclHR1_01170021 [Rhizophagus clarus]|uniref:Serine-threonine/tyrosine-protein kinase catalytic domain-containing protein n=1 Tax=Rhizophagus clarus TaxID=94130 RepID=A0A2Z6Q547_9GLOM|nr:hypothetical protein RclHR1_01170021 [Rhizophagus clarus]